MQAASSARSTAGAFSLGGLFGIWGWAGGSGHPCSASTTAMRRCTSTCSPSARAGLLEQHFVPARFWGEAASGNKEISKSCNEKMLS